jgi:hypothetical protein
MVLDGGCWIQSFLLISCSCPGSFIKRYLPTYLPSPSSSLSIKSASWDGTVLRLSWSWPGGLVDGTHLLAICDNTRSDSAFRHVVDVTHRWRKVPTCPTTFESKFWGTVCFIPRVHVYCAHCLHCVNSELLFLVPNFLAKKFDPNKFLKEYSFGNSLFKIFIRFAKLSNLFIYLLLLLLLLNFPTILCKLTSKTQMKYFHISKSTQNTHNT